MKIDLPEHLLNAVITALEHKDAAQKALKHEDPVYLQAAEYFRQPEKKTAAREHRAPEPKRKQG